ncbi:MAG TPA: alpha/beta hydrolase [Planctomycetaceae bacterium]|nr:alpha/beta hydrolase [Planctomycetaceae bacterium]
MNEEQTATVTPAPVRGTRRLSSRQRLVIAGVAFAFGLLCFFVDPLGRLEQALVFIPRSPSVGDWHPAGVVFEDASFQAADSTKLHGWFLPHEKPRAVVLFCHGNEGNVATWRGNFALLHDLAGVAVLGFDYRGYGRSEGSPSETGIFADARAARAWLAHRTGIPESQVVLLGRSLGGAVAIDLAAKDGARALVVESTFTSAPELAGAIVPWLPLRYLMRTELNSIAKIKNYHGPFMQSHGTEDRLVPYAMGQRLFAAANEPKRFVSIPHGGHNDPQTEEYYAVLKDFLDRL